MEQLLEIFILPINIIMHEDSPIQKLYYSIYNGQSLVSICGAVCVGNGIFFYFNEDGKLYLHVLVKNIYHILKTNSLVLFIEFTEMNWKSSDVNVLCMSILLDKMGWFLGVIGKLHNDECLTYIFIRSVEVVLQLYLIKQFIDLGINN